MHTAGGRSTGVLRKKHVTYRRAIPGSVAHKALATFQERLQMSLQPFKKGTAPWLEPYGPALSDLISDKRNYPWQTAAFVPWRPKGRPGSGPLGVGVDASVRVIVDPGAAASPAVSRTKKGVAGSLSPERAYEGAGSF